MYRYMGVVDVKSLNCYCYYRILRSFNSEFVTVTVTVTVYRFGFDFMSYSCAIPGHHYDCSATVNQNAISQPFSLWLFLSLESKLPQTKSHCRAHLQHLQNRSSSRTPPVVTTKTCYFRTVCTHWRHKLCTGVRAACIVCVCVCVCIIESCCLAGPKCAKSETKRIPQYFLTFLLI